MGLALVLVALIVAALAIGPSRDAIARLFGVEGSRIEFLPTPLPGETPTPFPSPTPTSTPGAHAIAPVDLAKVPELAGFEPALPDVEDPRLNSVLEFYGGQAVLMHHYTRFDVWETQLRQDAGFGKGVPEGGIVEEVEVGGVPGLWLTGAPHYVYYFAANGLTYAESERVITRNTLVWRTDAFFYRIETDLPLEEAIAIALTLP